MDHGLLLTGVTGFLGEALAQRLLLDEKLHLYLLVRGERSAGRTAADRVKSILQTLAIPEALAAGLADRVEAIEGDITLDRLGLSPEAYDDLARRVTHVVHCAAAVRFDSTLEDARAINTRGTERMIAFARRAAELGRLDRFDYIGTAYVAGSRRGIVRENELDFAQGFSNAYEQSKFEAEKLVRAEIGRMPVTLFRPSVIVGDSQSGSTNNFRGFYAPLRLYFKKLILMVPCDPESHVDLVPVDYVADATVYLIEHQPPRGHCYHITAGLDRTSTIRQICQKVEEVFGVPMPRFVPMGLYRKWIRPVLLATLRGPRRDAMSKGEFFLPYLECGLRFDNANTRRDLEDSGLVCPRPDEYLIQVLTFVKSRWEERAAA